MVEASEHIEKLPEVDKTVDQYSIIAKFLNSIDYNSVVMFALPKDEFIDLHIKLHEMNTGTKFFPPDNIKEFEVQFEERLFTFVRLDEPDESN